MSKKIIIFAATNDRTMKKILLMALATVILTACRQDVQEDKYNITSKFNVTYNIYESFENNDDGSITYHAAAWGGLVGVMKERNLPVDWTPYESITFEFAEPTKIETQVLISEKVKTWGRAGISSLTCFFDGLDVRNVSEVLFQATDSTTITIKSVRLATGIPGPSGRMNVTSTTGKTVSTSRRNTSRISRKATNWNLSSLPTEPISAVLTGSSRPSTLLPR